MDASEVAGEIYNVALRETSPPRSALASLMGGQWAPGSKLLFMYIAVEGLAIEVLHWSGCKDFVGTWRRLARDAWLALLHIAKPLLHHWN